MSLIKTIHIATALISISGFILRGILLLRESPIMQQRWIKIVPHINDTILLVTGISMAVMIQQYPFVHGWLTAKVVALLIYIGLGFMTIRFGHRRRDRIMTMLAAIIVFAYMLGVAVTRQPFFFL